MIELHEICYLADGKTDERTKQFASKKALIKSLNNLPLPSVVKYELTKYHEADFELLGIKRKMTITESIDE